MYIPFLETFSCITGKLKNHSFTFEFNRLLCPLLNVPMGRSGGSPHCIVGCCKTASCVCFSGCDTAAITRNLSLCTVNMQLSLFLPLFILLLLLFCCSSSSCSSCSCSSSSAFCFCLCSYSSSSIVVLLFFIVILRTEGEDSNLLKSFALSLGK